MLSWWNPSSSTAYPYPSIKYLNHRHCSKALSAPTISASVELLSFIFFFHDISIINTYPMNIIASVCPLQYGCAAKDTLTHHLMNLRTSALGMSGRCTIPLVYLITLTICFHSSSSGLLTQVHRKSMDILIYFLALDMKNRSRATVWCNDVFRSLFSSV